MRDERVRSPRAPDSLRTDVLPVHLQRGYQSTRACNAMMRGAMVPAARPVPVATYLPVLALLFTEFNGAPAGVVKVYDAFMLVNCTSLNTLKASIRSLIPLFRRPARLMGKRRDRVRSNSCHVGWRRMRTPLLPKFPMLPFGWGMRNAARLKCGRSASGMFGSPVYSTKSGSPVSSHRDPTPSVSDGLLLLTPAVLEEQLGVMPCPLSSLKMPDTCQSMMICLITGVCRNVGMS